MIDIFRLISEFKIFFIFFGWHEVINIRLILLLSVIVAKNNIYELIDLRFFWANIAQHCSTTIVVVCNYVTVLVLCVLYHSHCSCSMFHIYLKAPEAAGLGVRSMWLSAGHRTWLKLSRALCRLACIPVGGSLVILMEFSRMPCGMMWPSGEDDGSALMKTLKFWWLPSASCSSFFSRVPSHLETKWIF